MWLCGAQVIQPTIVWVIKVSWVSPKTFPDCWSCLLGHEASALRWENSPSFIAGHSSCSTTSLQDRGAFWMPLYEVFWACPSSRKLGAHPGHSKSRLARELVNVSTEAMWEVAVEKESGAWLNCCPHDRIGCRKWMDGCLVWCVHRMLHSRPNVPRTCNERWALSLMHMPRVVFLIMKCIIPLVYCSFDLMKIQFVLWFMARLICVPVNNQLILFRCGKEPVHSDLTGLILASCNKWCLQIRDIHCVYFFPPRDPPKKNPPKQLQLFF